MSNVDKHNGVPPHFGSEITKYLNTNYLEKWTEWSGSSARQARLL